MTENSDSENKMKNDDSSLDKLVKNAKDKGFVTYGEINDAIPNDKKMSVDDLEQVISKFSDAGVEFLEDDEDIKLDINIDEEVVISTTNIDSEGEAEEEEAEIASSTDDPVRLYLRDMGGVELLSREGEIEIAKKIEEGQEIMMTSLCESPVTMKQLIKWYEDLVNEKIMLRDLIDFESNIAEESVAEGDDDHDLEADDDSEVSTDDSDASTEIDSKEPIVAIESQLLPTVIDKMHDISEISQNLLNIIEKYYNKNKDAAGLASNKHYIKELPVLVEAVRDLRLSAKSTQIILDKLYGANRKIFVIESTSLKLAEKYKVTRQSFLDNYLGKEINTSWITEMGQNEGKNSSQQKRNL